jgi:hypothetical protein
MSNLRVFQRYQGTQDKPTGFHLDHIHRHKSWVHQCPERGHSIRTEPKDVDNCPEHEAAHITFAPLPECYSSGQYALRVPGLRKRNRGKLVT